MNVSLFRTNLKTLLEAATSGVDIHKYPPGDQARQRPSIAFGTIAQVTFEDGAVRDLLDRLYTVDGGGYVPVVSSTDAAFATAEQTATGLIDTLASTLRADGSVGTACTQARLTSWQMAPTSEANRHYMDFTFQLTVRDISDD